MTTKMRHPFFIEWKKHKLANLPLALSLWII